MKGNSSPLPCCSIFNSTVVNLKNKLNVYLIQNYVKINYTRVSVVLQNLGENLFIPMEREFGKIIDEGFIRFYIDGRLMLASAMGFVLHPI
jgi:hypothetical protein